MKEKTITIEKRFLTSMISDIENMIDNIEMMVDRSSMKTVKKRLEDVKKGRVKGLSEKDFKNYVKKRV
jgi:hypothetical protein